MSVSKRLTLPDHSQLAYEIYGTGFPLILLHGNGNDRAYFANQLADFAKKYQVIVIDSRGHGQSTNQQSNVSYRLMAEDLAAVFKHEHLQQAHLLGFSDGANIAMIFAALYPNKVAKLVLNAGNLQLSGIRPVVRWATYIQYLFVKLLSLFSAHFKRRAPFVHLMLQPTGLSKEYLSYITAQTLVIVGKKDVIKVEHSLAIASAIPKAKFVLIPNQGHRLARTSPQLFNKEVLQFLEGVN